MGDLKVFLMVAGFQVVCRSPFFVIFALLRKVLVLSVLLPMVFVKGHLVQRIGKAKKVWLSGFDQKLYASASPAGAAW